MIKDDKMLIKVLEEWRDNLQEEYIKGSLYEYVSEELETFDIEFRTGLTSKGLEYRGVEIMIEFGGPNVIIDTTSKLSLKGGWGGSRADLYLDDEIIDIINDYFEDLFYSIRG